MSAAIRAFIAVELGVEAAAAVEAVQAAMTRAVPRGSVRWTRPEQIHLTLQFLGNVAADRIEDLQGKLVPALAGSPAFTLRLDRIGVFPSSGTPRVIWVGLGGDLPALLALQSRVADASRAFGDHDEAREFHPHLTLGRVNRIHSRAMHALTTTIGAQANPPPAAWRVGEVRLIRSELRPAGAVYTVLARFALV